MIRKISLNDDLCPKNHHCPAVRICPVDAISQVSPFTAPEVDKESCILCGKCIKVCPTNALFLQMK